eukprot:gene2776-5629_t
MSVHRGVEGAYGDLAERRARLDSKYDPDVEKIHVSFIEANTGEKKTGSFHEWLKSGVALCKLLNALQPGSIKNIHTGSLAFKQMENISQFLSALPGYGVRVEDVFQTADLFEGVNMTAVQICLESLRRISEMKKKGVKVESQAPKRATVSLPSGSTPLGQAQQPAHVSTSSGPKYASEQADDAAYGDLAERKARMQAKYRPEVEKEVRNWIEMKIGMKLEGAIPKINESTMAFKQMENINNFLQFAGSAGVKPNDLFQTVSLYEAENMAQKTSDDIVATASHSAAFNHTCNLCLDMMRCKWYLQRDVKIPTGTGNVYRTLPAMLNCVLGKCVQCLRCHVLWCKMIAAAGAVTFRCFNECAQERVRAQRLEVVQYQGHACGWRCKQTPLRWFQIVECQKALKR